MGYLIWGCNMFKDKVAELEARVVELEESLVRKQREIDELYNLIEGDANLRESVKKLYLECESMASKLASLHGTSQADWFFLPRFLE